LNRNTSISTIDSGTGRLTTAKMKSIQATATGTMADNGGLRRPSA
jgi:hypothetical protein